MIGEYERAFYGSQYAAMAPPFEHYGLVKRAGTAGEFSVGNAPDDRCGDKEEVLAAAAT